MPSPISNAPAPPVVADESSLLEQLFASPATHETTEPADAANPPQLTLNAGKYQLRFVQTAAELDAVLKLRFEVFNLELAEGLSGSFATGRDEDEFDRVCHHLLVEDKTRGAIIGTYRLQTTEMAAQVGGFYSANEFDFTALPPEMLNNAVELGRACIAREHRNTQVLYLLWCGLAAYLMRARKRYFFGCCSLTSQDESEGWRIYDYLKNNGHFSGKFHVGALPACACRRPDKSAADVAVKIPRLFRTYLRFGVRVCSEPAIDRAFRTIDYLVLFDAETMDEKVWRMFFSEML